MTAASELRNEWRQINLGQYTFGDDLLVENELDLPFEIADESDIPDICPCRVALY